MKRLILFGSICLALAVVASAMATQAPMPRDEEGIFIMEDQRFPTHVDSSAPGLGKAYADTFFLLGGNRLEQSYLITNFDAEIPPPVAPVQSYWSGKFEDEFGNLHWQGWHHSRMAPTDNGTWPGWDLNYSPEHQWSITGDKGTGYGAGNWGWWETWMNPPLSPSHPNYTLLSPLYGTQGADLVLEGDRSLWIGQYAPPDWDFTGQSGFSPPGWEGKPGYGNRYGWSSWVYQNFDIPAGTGDVELEWRYRYHVSCDWWGEEGEEGLYMQYYDEVEEAWETLVWHTGQPGEVSGVWGFGWDDNGGISNEILQPITPAQYGEQLQLRIRFYSGDSLTDQAGWFHSYKGGAVLDNIEVIITDGSMAELASSYSDFEGLAPTEPVGPNLPILFADWTARTPGGVGNFAGAYKFPNIGQLPDMCGDNKTWMISFANIGQYETFAEPMFVPKRSGNTWQYGPSASINEWRGGMLGEAGVDNATLFNFLRSPILDMQDIVSGGPIPDQIMLRFDCMRHQIYPGDTSPYIFYRYMIRGGATLAEVNSSLWSISAWYYGGPDWIRSNFVIGSWIDASDRYFQIALGAAQWQRNGSDGTPTPYYDNVAVAVYQQNGPFINSDPVYLAQDNFPEEINYTNRTDPGNRIRFDGAWDLNPRSVATIRVQDSIAVWVDITREGYVHDPANLPRAFFAIKPNTLWTVPTLADDMTKDRQYPSSRGFLNYQYSNGIITFEKELQQAVSAAPPYLPIANRYWFDIDGDGNHGVPPDPVFFPGDILHYYIKAWDMPAGGGTSREGTLPNNLTYFGNFDQAGLYSLDFTVRGLPAVKADGGSKGSIEPATDVLWVNAFGNRGGASYWRVALANNGLHEWGSNPGGLPTYYDTYHVHRPDNTGGNHIAGRATLADIQNYKTILFSFGNLDANIMGTATIEGNEYMNKSNCVALMQSWLDLGNKNVAFMGNDLAYSNSRTGAGALFNANYLGVTFVAPDVRPQIGAQFSPMVRPHPEATGVNPVLLAETAYLAWGDCPVIHEFDNVIPVMGVSSRFAAFANPGADPPPGGTWTPYGMAAGIYRAWNGNQIVYTPYDLQYVRAIPGYTYPTGQSARSVLLGDILDTFGTGTGLPTGVPENRVLTVSNYPNPFNPATTIQLSLPRTGEVSLKVYNVRGELVRTLVNGVLDEGEHEFVWDGTSDRGAQTASGIYFYETRANGEVKVNKMALVK